FHNLLPDVAALIETDRVHLTRFLNEMPLCNVFPIAWDCALHPDDTGSFSICFFSQSCNQSLTVFRGSDNPESFPIETIDLCPSPVNGRIIGFRWKNSQ